MDQDVINLAKAIRERESKGDFNAVGDAGTSHGAYQFQPGTWKQYSKEILGVDNAEMTPQNQNAVAYGKIKKWKDAGNNAGQIAAMWNAGENIGDKWTTNVGSTVINGQKIDYNTPQYVKDVMGHYQKFKGGYNPKPYSNGIILNTSGAAPQTSQNAQPEQKDNLGGDLIKRTNEFAGAVTDTMSGKINPLSGVLQGAGAVAGGLGDVVSRALELAPGVKEVEGLIGKGVGALAKTDAGQTVIKKASEFGEEHPEAAGNLSAAFNIVTAIPILKGLGIAGKVGADAASVALKKQAEKTFEKEAVSVITKTARGTEFLRTKPNVVKDMINERLLPNIDNGVYNVVESQNLSDDLLKGLNKNIQTKLENYAETRVADEADTILKNVLNGYTDRNGNIIQGFKNSNFTPEYIIEQARSLTPQNGKLWDKFIKGETSLKETNLLRSDLDAAVKSVYSSVNEPPIKKEIGATLAGAMRDFIQTTLPETQPLFGRMTSIFDIQKALKAMSAKTIKPGAIPGFIEGATKDIPVVRRIGKYAANKVANVNMGILKRTAPGASRVTGRQLKVGLPGLFAAPTNVDQR